METLRTIDQLIAAFEAHGYFVAAEPLLGQEDLFASSLREGLASVEAVMAVNARRYRVRGRSQRALAMLHSALPEPVWGVEVA